MKYFCHCFAILFLSCLAARASVFENLTITITNAAGTTNGQLLTVNSDVRTWTNVVYVPASQILTNSSASGAAANLRNHLGIYGFTGLKVYAFTSTSTTLRSGDGGHIVASLSAGWGTLTYTTNTYGTNVAVRVPLEGEPSPAQRTNIASGIGHMINSSANTNLTLVHGTNVSGAVPQATHATNADNATYSTNSVHLLSTFASASNSITLNNGYWAYQAIGPFSVTNCVGSTAGFGTWATLWASNSLSTSITGYVTVPTIRAIGPGTTNALVIAAGKAGVFSFFAPGTFATNYCTAAQQ